MRADHRALTSEGEDGKRGQVDELCRLLTLMKGRPAGRADRVFEGGAVAQADRQRDKARRR